MRDGSRALGSSNGPGINSGAMLETMVGDAIKAKCGDADITLGQVKKRFGKRLVIIVSELDSGRERQLTPEVRLRGRGRVRDGATLSPSPYPHP